MECPTLWEYLAFAFHPATLLAGPITPYSRFRKSLDRAGKPAAAPAQCWLRFFVGLGKYMFLAQLCNTIAYEGLLFDGNQHAAVDLLISAVAYMFFLYLNFSGWCDMAISMSALAGVDVAENFRDPFLSRNLQIFWTRWHMTLTSYMRDVVYAPVFRLLSRFLGESNAAHAAAVSILLVFVLIGLWHGVTAGFVLFGLLQGIGVAAVRYYTIYLKRRLGQDGYRRYMGNRWIQYVSTTISFCYISGSFFFFANPIGRAGEALARLSGPK